MMEQPLASAADYEELRSVDAWLNLMCDLEDLEHEHLINLAISYAPTPLARVRRREGFQHHGQPNSTARHTTDGYVCG
jgi:hypothetical protein